MLMQQMKSTKKYRKSAAQEKLKYHLQHRPKSNIESTVENCEKEASCLNFVQPDFYQAFFKISNFAEEGFSVEDYNASDVEVA